MPLKKLTNDELIAKKEKEQRQAQLKAENQKRSTQALAKIKAKHDLQSQKETKKHGTYNPWNYIKPFYRNNPYAPLFAHAYLDCETPKLKITEKTPEPEESVEPVEPVKKLKVVMRNAAH